MDGAFYFVLNAAFAYGIAAGIGALCVQLVKDKKKKTIIVVVVTVALGGVLSYIGREKVVPRLAADDFQANLKAELARPDYPLASIFKERPDLVPIYESELVEAYRTGGNKAVSLAAQEFGRKYLGASLIQMAARASDTDLIRFLDLMNIILDEMSKDDPVTCFHYLFGGGDPVKIDQVFRKGRKEEIAALLLEIGKASEKPVALPISSKEFDELSGLIAQKLRDEWNFAPEQIQMTQSPASATTNEDKTILCQVTRALYSEIAKFPENSGPAYFRAMVDGNLSPK